VSLSPATRPLRLLTGLTLSLVLVPAASAQAAAPASAYNKPGVNHCIDEGVAIRGDRPDAALRGGAFGPLETASGGFLRARGKFRAQGHEAIRAKRPGDSTTYTTYFGWGFKTANESGSVWLGDLNERPYTGNTARCTEGNGKPASDITLRNGQRKSYFVSPTAIPTTLKYDRTNGTLGDYENYGTPGAPEAPYHTNLSWTWVNNGRVGASNAISGGGIQRSMIRRGEVFYPSNVATLKSYDTSGSGGYVRAMYGSFWTGAQRVYGWMVHSHSAGGGYREHVSCRTC